MKRMLAECPAERTLKAIEGRWKIFILHHLFHGPMRTHELRRAISATASSVSQKMLTEELRSMEQDGLLFRRDLSDKSPKIEYALTPLGMRLRTVIETMVQWGFDQELEVYGYQRSGPCTLGTSFVNPPPKLGGVQISER